MARFEVFAAPAQSGAAWLLDVQANLLEDLATRIVVPLMPLSASLKPVRQLNPVFEIEGQDCMMLTQALASIPARELKRPVTSLAARQDEITQALDLLLTGF